MKSEDPESELLSCNSAWSGMAFVPAREYRFQIRCPFYTLAHYTLARFSPGSAPPNL